LSPARFSVKQVVLVNLLFVVLMVTGLFVTSRVAVDVYPDIDFNSVVITTVWQGASPDEVERLITTKLEDEIQDVNGIRELFSLSSPGVSRVDIDWEVTLSDSEQKASLADLRAAVDRVDDLPSDAEEPILRELSVSEVFNIVMVTVSDVGDVGEFTLREVTRDLERRLERVPGVRKASPMDMRDRELRVFVDEDRALQYDLTLAEISEVIARNNQNVPGGTLSDSLHSEIRLRGLGNFVSPEELAATVVKKDPEGRHVRLGELARVVDDFERRRYYGRTNGNDSLSLGISKTADADITEVVAGVREIVERENALVPPGVELGLVFDGSEFLGKRMQVLRSNLVLGVVLVVFILWLTVGFRNALLAIVGVPFSFLTALILFPILGITINSLSIVGLVMVSGMVVDDAIIVLENIYQHIERGESVIEATVRGTEEVMWPVTAAIATTMAAFIPMLMVTGTSGEFMSILPKTVIACLAASLLEALVILPAHYLDWGSRRIAGEGVQDAGRGIRGASRRIRASVDASLRRARDVYLRVQSGAIEHRYLFLAMCVATLYLSCGVAQHIKVDLFPSDDNQLFVTVEAPPDFGIDQTDRVVRGVEDALHGIGHEFKEVSTIVGQGMSADEIPKFGSNYGILYIGYPNSPENLEDPTRMLRVVRRELEAYVERAKPPGLETYIVSMPRQGPPIGKPVAIRVQSDDYRVGKLIAGEIQAELGKVPGVFNIEDNAPYGPRELKVRLDENRASLHGLTFEDLGTTLRAANDGLVPSSFKDPGADEDIDIRVQLEPEQRREIADLLDVELRTPEGYRVEVGDVAEIEIERGFQQLYHYDGRRSIVVYADVDNDQATSLSVNELMRERFADIPQLYPGVSLVFGGEFQGTQEAFDDMGRAFIIAIIAIYSILAAQFRSYSQPLVVMSVIVFAYIGVVLGLWIWDYALSMYVIYALVGLAGIVVNDSLVLIDFANQERARGTPVGEAIVVASSRRFRPILLTTLTTVAGLLPLAMGFGGRSPSFGPFAAAIVAGLAVASLLTLFVVPALYLSLEDLLARLRRWRGREGDPLREGIVALEDLS